MTDRPTDGHDGSKGSFTSNYSGCQYTDKQIAINTLKTKRIMIAQIEEVKKIDYDDKHIASIDVHCVP